MQIVGSAQLSGPDPLQRLLGLLPSQTQGAGQTSPVGAEDTAEPPSPSPPKADQGPAARFAARTLASLLQVQQQPPAAGDLADALIGQADVNGDGGLSIEEIQAELAKAGDSATGAQAISQAMTKLDTDGDGKLSAGELAAGFEALAQARGQTQTASQADPAAGAPAPPGLRHRHHGHHGVSSTDLAQLLLGAGDADGDGKLSGAELAAAIDAMRQAPGPSTASAAAYQAATAVTA